MKALIGLVIGLTLSIGAIANNDSSQSPFAQNSNVDNLIQGGGDDFVPWPWGSEMPFPWPFVQGVWKAEKGEFRSFFKFEIVKDKDGIRQLRVTQIDPVTCLIQAQGVAIEWNNMVRAQMTGRSGNTYRLSLRSFSENSIVRAVEIPEKPINGQYVVLSLFPFERTTGVHLPIQQISTQIHYKCLVER